MNLDTSSNKADKLRSKVAKLAAFISENNIDKNDILELCMSDAEFSVNRDIIGKALNYFEWRVHPLHPEIECSTEGEVKINGSLIAPKTYRGYKTYKYVRGKKTYDIDIPIMVLSTYVPMPKEGKWTVGYRDENPDNTRINNLYWRKLGR